MRNLNIGVFTKPLVDHRIFIIYLLLYFAVSLFTLRDFPTVDLTNDDMWMMDECLSLMHNGRIFHTFSLSESFNTSEFPFNLNTFSNATFYSVFGASIYSLRLKSLFIGALFLMVFYYFINSTFKNQTVALSGTIILSLTHAFIYRSHDSRPDIFSAFLFFLMFISAYKIIHDSKSNTSQYVVLFFIPLVIFRYVHPNGIVFLLTAFITCLIADRSIVKDKRLYIGIFVGFTCFVLMDQAFQFIQNSFAMPKDDRHLSLESRLELLPVYRSLIVDTPLEMIKSIYRLIRLCVRAPLRSIQLMNHSSFLAFNDYLIITSALLLSAARILKLNKPVIMTYIWVFSYFLFFSLLSPSSTDYAISFIPFFIVILLYAAMIIFQGNVRRFTICMMSVAGVMLFSFVYTLYDYRYIKLYDLEFREISSNIRSLIPPKSSILGAPLYFTIFKPTDEYDYKEIYKSLGIDFMHKTLVGNEPYDFSLSFKAKKFDYVIFDGYFKNQIARAGLDPEEFVSHYLSGYITIWKHISNYPTSRGPLESITVYKRNPIN